MGTFARNSSKHSKYQFTLIELLIVIAIILILMSMLLPGLKRAKKVSERAVCASNLHQMALGVVSFSDDHNDKMPLACFPQLYRQNIRVLDNTARSQINTFYGFTPDTYINLGALYQYKYNEDKWSYYCPGYASREASLAKAGLPIFVDGNVQWKDGWQSEYSYLFNYYDGDPSSTQAYPKYEYFSKFPRQKVLMTEDLWYTGFKNHDRFLNIVYNDLSVQPILDKNAYAVRMSMTSSNQMSSCVANVLIALERD